MQDVKINKFYTTRRSLSDGLPAKQLAFILFIATSEPLHFP